MHKLRRQFRYCSEMIKVKDFAKCDGSENKVIGQPVSTDIISISSDENIPEDIKPPVDTEPTTPKPTRQRKPRVPRLTLTAISKKHISKTVLNFRNHKISEYFQSAKKDCKFILFPFDLLFSGFFGGNSRKSVHTNRIKLGNYFCSH